MCIYVSDIRAKRYTHMHAHTYTDPNTILRLGARNLLQPHCSVMFEFRRLRRRDARVAFNLRCVTFIAYTCVYALSWPRCITRRVTDARKKNKREKEGLLCALYIYTVARKYGEARDDS